MTQTAATILPHYQPYADFPTIDLYMDQVLELITTELQRAGMTLEESALTATMVNNYVKAGVLPRPINKRYNRDQIVQLMIITVAKSVLTLSEIKNLFQIAEKVNLSVEAVYTFFCEEIMLERSTHPMPDLTSADTRSETEQESVRLIIKHVTRAFLEKLRAERLLSKTSEKMPGSEIEKKK